MGHPWPTETLNLFRVSLSSRHIPVSPDGLPTIVPGKVFGGGGLRAAIFVLLLLVCPVLATDFVVSSGVVPISYVLFYFILPYPSPFILAYWVIVPWALLFYYLSGVAGRRLQRLPVSRRPHVVLALMLLAAAVSLSPIYSPIAHNAKGWRNLISLFHDEWRNAEKA